MLDTPSGVHPTAVSILCPGRQLRKEVRCRFLHAGELFTEDSDYRNETAFADHAHRAAEPAKEVSRFPEMSGEPVVMKLVHISTSRSKNLRTHRRVNEGSKKITAFCDSQIELAT